MVRLYRKHGCPSMAMMPGMEHRLELAHHLLQSIDDGAHLAADVLLGFLASAPDRVVELGRAVDHRDHHVLLLSENRVLPLRLALEELLDPVSQQSLLSRP